MLAGHLVKMLDILANLFCDEMIGCFLITTTKLLLLCRFCS